MKAFTGVNFLRAAAFVFAAAPAVCAAQQIDVRGDSAAYGADGKRTEFTGNVVVRSGGVTVRADRLVVSAFAEGNTYRAFGAPVVAECAECADVSLHLRAPEIIMRDGTGVLDAGGGVAVCAGADEVCERGRLNAESAVWRRDAGEMELRGAPVVEGEWNPEDGGAPVSLRAESAAYFGKSGVLELRGGALVRRGGEEIRGGEIKINIKTGEIAAGGGGDRVRGVFGGGG